MAPSTSSLMAENIAVPSISTWEAFIFTVSADCLMVEIMVSLSVFFSTSEDIPSVVTFISALAADTCESV